MQNRVWATGYNMVAIPRPARGWMGWWRYVVQLGDRGGVQHAATGTRGAGSGKHDC